jgi:hypothetical protein
LCCFLWVLCCSGFTIMDVPFTLCDPKLSCTSVYQKKEIKQHANVVSSTK